ncbi:MAG: hypothetical protein MRK01_04850 [Candidatus Scalindua sp.]|nr:hypothetical protein [Candidatus Scalindua sp.]
MTIDCITKAVSYLIGQELCTTDSMQQHARPTMVEDVERNLNEVLKYGDN